MKNRIAFRVVVLLVIGAVLNVLVAWGIVCWSPIGQVRYSVPGGDWEAPAPRHWPEVTSMSVYRGAGVDKSYRSERLNLQFDYCTQGVLRAGWPARSMYYERHCVENLLGYPADWPGAYRVPESFLDGLRIPQWVPKCRFNDTLIIERRFLPTRIYFSGFAINAFFYAGVCALIAPGLRAVRNRLRTSVGCCAFCGYDLHGNLSGVCPECGNVGARGAL